jgi:hypothetical protein
MYAEIAATTRGGACAICTRAKARIRIFFFAKYTYYCYIHIALEAKLACECCLFSIHINIHRRKSEQRREDSRRSQALEAKRASVFCPHAGHNTWDQLTEEQRLAATSLNVSPRYFFSQTKISQCLPQVSIMGTTRSLFKFKPRHLSLSLSPSLSLSVSLSLSLSPRLFLSLSLSLSLALSPFSLSRSTIPKAIFFI